MELNRTEAATALGIDPTTLDSWVRQGAPVVEKNGKGRPSAYSLPDLVQWRIQHEISRALDRLEQKADPGEIDRLRARRLELENQRRELDLDKVRGELVGAAEVAAAMSKLVVGGRSHLMAIVPSRIAAEAEAAPNGSIREIARREIRMALEDWGTRGIADVIRTCGGAIDPAAVAGCPTCCRIIDEIEQEAEGRNDG